MEQKNHIRMRILRKTDRITIGKGALQALGMPESVLILVNPEEQTIVLMPNTARDPRGCKVHMDSKGSFRLCSKRLILDMEPLLTDYAGEDTITLLGTVTESGVLFHCTPRSHAKGRLST